MKSVINIFESNPYRYQPDRNHTFNYDPDYTLNQRRLATLVGLTAVGLPIILFAGTWFGTCFYYSISHFYYAQFLGGVFIATLVFIATFLIAYRGSNVDESKLASLAGICALSVALFPTEGRGCSLTEFSGRALADFTLGSTADFVTVAEATEANPYFQLFPYAGALHFVSAALFFAFLAYYSLRVFTRVIPEEHYIDGHAEPDLEAVKTTRNGIYIVSGWTIIFCMAAMFANFFYEWLTGASFKWWYDFNVTFWLETASLWAFGVSWMVKGRFFGNYLLDDQDKQKGRQPSM